MRRIAKILSAAVIGAGMVLGSVTATTAPAEAKVVRIEAASKDGGKVLKYVEPLRIRKGTPTRLFVEFRDGSEFIFTPCVLEDSPNCFWWGPGVGNREGRSFVDLRGKIYFL